LLGENGLRWEDAVLRKSFHFFWVAVVLCVGCAHKAATYDRATGLAETENFHYAPVALRISGAGGAGTVFAAPRFVAVRHKLEIMEAGSGLAKSIEAVIAFCGTIQCEVLSSSVTYETAILSPSGNITARVAPQDLTKFLDFVGKQGKIAQHATELEDKTAAVVDVEAKLKNQTDFRDSLRRMLTKTGVSVADLLQIQEKLAEAQAELDSEAKRRSARSSRTKPKRSMLKSPSRLRSALLPAVPSRPSAKRCAIPVPSWAKASPR
jgi:Domain of unknown function (DUF4349)